MRQSQKFLVGTALAVLFTTAARAETTSPQASNTSPPDPTTQAAPNPAATGDVIVTAQRRAESVTKVPVSITTANRKELEQSGVSSTAELTRIVPGLIFTGTGAWTMPSLRGVSTTVSGPGNDSPIAMYIDGIYLPNELGGFFDLPDIERVEVDKGPQGTLFGRNATGGAIQIFPRAPSFKPTADITATAGLYTGSGSSRVAADTGVKGYVSGPLNDQIAASLAFHYNYADGYLNDIVRHQSYGRIVDEGVRAKVLFRLSEAASFTLTGFYNNRNDDHAAAAVALDGISIGTLWPGSYVTSEPWQITSGQRPFVNTQTIGASLRGDIDVGRGTLTTLTSYYDLRLNADIDTDLTYSLSCLEANACVDFKLPNLSEHTFSQEVYYASQKWGPVSFVTGANMYFSTGFQPGVINDFSHVAPFPQVANSGPIFAFSVQVKTQAYGAYGEFYYDVTDRLHLIGGLRYSYENKRGIGGDTCCDVSQLSPFADQTWSNVIGRASARYDLTPDSNVYFTFSQGFKSGVVPYSDFTAPTAKPENINAYELGYKHGGSTWPFSISAFYYDYTNMQEQTFNGIVSYVTNAARASIAGVDFDGTYRPTDYFDVHLGLSWLPIAKYDNYEGAIAYDFPLTPYGLTQYIVSMTGKRIIKTAEFTGTLTATYQRDVGPGNLTVSATLYGSTSYYYDFADIIREKGYVTLGSEISYRPNGSHFKFSLWGKNLTNAAYITSAIPGPSTADVLYGAPTEVGVSLNYSF